MKPVRALVAALAAALTLTSCGVVGGSRPATTDQAAAVTLHDAAGRTVTLPKRPERVVLGESRQAYALLFLNKDKPTEKVAAWGTDMERAAPDVWRRLTSTFPQAKDVPTIGSVFSGDVSVEAVLSRWPDIFLMTLDAYEAARKNGLVDQLDKAKVTYAVTDFRLQPLQNTRTSITLLGQVFDREEQAREFNDYYAGVVDPVVERAARLKPQPTTMLWRAPGITPCCATYAKANFGAIITATGGTNIADTLLSGQEGSLTPEQVLKSAPQSVIATGGEWGGMEKKPGVQVDHVHLGYDADVAGARASLLALRKQPGFEHLAAYDAGRVHGIYHQFYDSPYNFVAVLAFARWQHPQELKDLDPEKTWAQFHERFMPWEAEGVFTVSVR